MKVYLRLERVKRSNQLRNLDDLFVGQQILAGLAEEDYFLVDRVERYIDFATESEEGRRVFMKLIRHLEAKKSKREFMRFVADTAYKHRALIQ